jgi:hypothetical protein
MTAVKAKAASPTAPRTPPLASDQALVVPSYFSIKVRVAGTTAGKARKSPPIRRLGLEELGPIEPYGFVVILDQGGRPSLTDRRPDRGH